ncbi:ATP synthase subunit I [uncultured Paraglaciecola sp.]|uniref:ATP synthase subunit I n=1 Tax=uncultured Paraglaciecola sp. TaxID=1765024 RepID=UPI0030D8DDB3|tara:strand:- start:141927 stop:142262 length:336 start_codon:yes stop_codon:yes gene_type:complete
MINALTEILYSPLELCINLLFGFVLGSLFFLSLWWTVFRGLTSERPVMWFVSGFFIRIATALFGFYFIADGHWQPLTISLIGFILARPATKLLIDLTNNNTHTKVKIKNAT